MHDKEGKFTKGFADKLKARGVRTNSLSRASPNLDGRVESVIGTLQWECLDKFLVFGKRHFDYLISPFVDYTKRSSMVWDHLPPVRDEPEEVDLLQLDQIEVQSHVGRLVKSFVRKAA